MSEQASTKTLKLPKANIQSSNLGELPVIWVHTEEDLYKLIDEIDSVDMVALDTEFIRRTTYYPILALVQVNTGHAIYLVDAPRLDLSEFWQALAEVPTMIWYACGEDLSIFYLLSDCPVLTNVFDVQIGVAYLTGRLQAGYSQTVHEVFGIELDKAESKSNWLARPLSYEQETYAANDVRYLLELYQVIAQSLAQKNLLAYAQEDCRHYAQDIYNIQNMPDSQLYLDLILPTYSRRQLGLLQQLTMWRETLARATNEPKIFIISKQALREIVVEMPDNIKALARTTLNRGTLRRYGDEIVKMVRQVKSLSEKNLPPLPSPIYQSKDKPFNKDLDALLEQYSQQSQIPKNLLLKNRWINNLLVAVAHNQDLDKLPQAMQGYRKTLIQEQVLPLLGQYREHILSSLQQIDMESP